jgi:hypothetical protein
VVRVSSRFEVVRWLLLTSAGKYGRLPAARKMPQIDLVRQLMNSAADKLELKRARRQSPAPSGDGDYGPGYRCLVKRVS